MRLWLRRILRSAADHYWSDWSTACLRVYRLSNLRVSHGLQSFLSGNVWYESVKDIKTDIPESHWSVSLALGTPAMHI